MYMKSLYLTQTTKTPEIDFNVNGKFSITGNSYPEDVYEFYANVMQWLEEFVEKNVNEVELNVDLKFINTSSTRAILNIITKISASSNFKVNVTWNYDVEDDDMLEVGEDIQSLTNIKFLFVEKVS